MPGYAVLNFLIYVLINAFTPGPGNILALNTVTNYGYQKGLPLFLGIFSGYYVVQLVCALLVYAVSELQPNLLLIIKYVGAAYILWLAVHIAISKPVAGDQEKTASFTKGFLLQFVNVKIYLFGITALTGYVTDYSTDLGMLLIMEVIIATMGTIATSTWIGLGMLIQKFYNKNYRLVNIGLALILLECVFSMLKLDFIAP